MTTRSYPTENIAAFAGMQYDRSLLHSDVPRHLHRLRVCKNSIYESPLIKEQSSFALPIECDDVMESLESIDQSMSRIREVIKAAHDRKLKALPNPYMLLMYLYLADDYVHSAMRSVRQFRPICVNRTLKSKQSQTKVQGELWTLIQTCEKIEAETGIMLDELLLNS